MDQPLEDSVRIHPTVVRIHQMLAERDPEVLAAVADVDRTLIASVLQEPPLQRVRNSCLNARALARWKLCRTEQ